MSDASAEDIAIAKAALAGWTFVLLPSEVYEVVGPDGLLYAYRSTRYTAAEFALDYMNGIKYRGYK